MIRKQIFWDKTMEDKAEDVINEIITYIDNQHKSGILSANFFHSTLLFVAEFLPQMKNQNPWVDLGYRICRSFKQNMESYGYNHQIDMFGGMGYQCFSVNLFSQEANILQSFSRSMNKMLFIAVNDKLKQIENDATHDSDYDIISGISGVLYYLLDCEYAREEEMVLRRCIQYLLMLTEEGEFCGKSMIRFHVLQPNQNPNFDQEDFKNGSINFGLAHGMIGPLIALAKAYAKGFVVEGLMEGIEKLYHLYEIYQSLNEANVPYWPGRITVEEYWERACKPEHLHRPCSWCYGNIGILRGLQKVAGYMNWPEREREYIEAMKRFLAQDSKEYGLFSPSLCHGFSSVVAIQNCAYSAYGDPKLLTNLERNVWELVTEYRKHNEKEVSLMDIRDETIWVEGYLKDLSFLTGSIGVAATLLSLRGTMKTGKLLMID